MWLPLKFLAAVLRHWGVIVTGGVVIGLLSIWQNTGHVVGHWVYWLVAVIGLVIAFYRTWLSAHLEVMRLTAARNEEAREPTYEAARRQREEKRELVRALTVLRATQSEVLTWLDITDNKWGMAPATVKLLPDDWGSVVFVVGSISSGLRATVDRLSEHLSEANSLITRFLSAPVNFRDQRLIPPAHTHLSQGAPLLSSVIAEVESYEKSLR